MQFLLNLFFSQDKKYFQVKKNENKKFSVFKFDVHRWKPQTILNEMVVYELTSFTDWLVASFFLSFFTFLLCVRLPTTTFKKIFDESLQHSCYTLRLFNKCTAQMCGRVFKWVICAVDVFSISRLCDLSFGFVFPHSNNAKAKQLISQVEGKQICDFFHLMDRAGEWGIKRAAGWQWKGDSSHSHVGEFRVNNFWSDYGSSILFSFS